MRVNPNPMPDLLAALNQTQLEAQQALREISSGRSVNEPSDNPTAAALLVENNDQATFNNGYLQSLNSVQGQFSTADSTLSSVVTALQRPISLGAEGANGTPSDSDGAAVAPKLQGIQSRLFSLPNTSSRGHKRALNALQFGGDCGPVAIGERAIGALDTEADSSLQRGYDRTQRRIGGGEFSLNPGEILQVPVIPCTLFFSFLPPAPRRPLLLPLTP